MYAADVGYLALSLRDEAPALARRDLTGFHLRLARGHGVGHDVLVGPDHGVACGDLEALGIEFQALDPHRVRLSRGERRRGRDCDENREERRPEHGAYIFFARSTWTIFACSRCAAIAGRTFTMRALSSAFFALGMSVWSIASRTAWWYATS